MNRINTMNDNHTSPAQLAAAGLARTHGAMIGLCAAAVCAIAPVSGAAEIVNWGGHYVEDIQSFVLTSSTMTPPVEHYGGFDANGDPLKLSPDTDYTGTEFYGYVFVDEEGNSQMGVYNDVNGDFLRFKRDSTDVKALVLWRQADFGDGLDSGNVGFDATSTVSADISRIAGFSAGQVVIRLEGGNQDGYYISQEGPLASEVTMNTTSLTSLTWLAYDPATAIDAIGGSPIDLVANGRIDHITEVGFYSHSLTGANRLDIKTFVVTAVPEPASAALLAMGGLLMLRRRARRTV